MQAGAEAHHCYCCALSVMSFSPAKHNAKSTMGWARHLVLGLPTPLPSLGGYTWHGLLDRALRPRCWPVSLDLGLTVGTEWRSGWLRRYRLDSMPSAVYLNRCFRRCKLQSNDNLNQRLVNAGFLVQLDCCHLCFLSTQDAFPVHNMHRNQIQHAENNEIDGGIDLINNIYCIFFPHNLVTAELHRLGEKEWTQI